METGGTSRPVRQQGATQHEGIAGIIIGSDPAFITEEHIDPVPGKMLLTEKGIGLGRGTATGECDAAAIPLIEHEADLGCDGV